jgi:hypothetical protein
VKIPETAELKTALELDRYFMVLERECSIKLTLPHNLSDSIHRPQLVTPLLLALTISPLLLLAGDLNVIGRVSRKTLFTVSAMDTPIGQRTYCSGIVGLDKQTEAIRIPLTNRKPPLACNLSDRIVWETHQLRRGAIFFRFWTGHPGIENPISLQTSGRFRRN